MAPLDQAQPSCSHPAIVPCRTAPRLLGKTFDHRERKSDMRSQQVVRDDGAMSLPATPRWRDLPEPVAHRLRAQRGGEAIGLYLHVPFCASRCGYCDFNTYTAGELGSSSSPQSWSEAVRRELDGAADLLGSRPAN